MHTMGERWCIRKGQEMGSMQLFVTLLALMTVTLSALGHALSRIGSRRNQSAAPALSRCPNCDSVLEPSALYCTQCAQTAWPTSPDGRAGYFGSAGIEGSERMSADKRPQQG
jgi:hypothetical protein